jgi:hypothetical protein
MPVGRLYGLSADEERIHFHRAEIAVSQQPHELPGLRLCPRAVFARGGDPSPSTALAVAPSLMGKRAGCQQSDTMGFGEPGYAGLSIPRFVGG